MNKEIKIFKLRVKEKQIIEMPIGAEILDVQVQEGNACLCALVDSVVNTEGRLIEVFATGNKVPCGIGVYRNYIGAYQLDGIVFHVFERLY